RSRHVRSRPLRHHSVARVPSRGCALRSVFMSSSKSVSRLVLAGLLVPVPALVAAQSSLPQEPEVVVTASRTRIAVDEALASVSVIDRARIEQLGGLDIVDLLSREAGFDVIRSGGLGAQTAVFLRGS